MSSGGRNRKAETDNVYGRLSVIARSKSTANGRAMWKCRCVCGRIVTVSGDDLRRGHTVSCGCWKRQQSATRMRGKNLAARTIP